MRLAMQATAWVLQGSIIRAQIPRTEYFKKNSQTSTCMALMGHYNIFREFAVHVLDSSNKKSWWIYHNVTEGSSSENMTNGTNSLYTRIPARSCWMENEKTLIFKGTILRKTCAMLTNILGLHVESTMRRHGQAWPKKICFKFASMARNSLCQEAWISSWMAKKIPFE